MFQKYLLPKIGDKFGRLTVANNPFKRLDKVWCVKCLCDCGNKTISQCRYLQTGRSKSCGCYSAELTGNRTRTHGETKTRLYTIWIDMKKRCNNPNRKQFNDYGGRGIKVCDEWQNGFIPFRDWALSHGYRNDLTIDRKDNDGNYEPTNCRWVTRQTQSRNTRRNPYLSAFGETKLLIEWSEDPRCKVSYDILQERISKLKWSPERALTEISGHFVSAFGETKTVRSWADDPRCRVSYPTLLHRIISYKWDIETAITHPLSPRVSPKMEHHDSL